MIITSWLFLILVFFSDFDVSEISKKEMKTLARQIREGFTGSDIHTLWTNLHQEVERPFISGKYFKKLKIDGVEKFDLAKKDSKGAKRYTLGKDFTMEDVVPQKITKKLIEKEILKIDVKDELIQHQTEMIEKVSKW